MAATSSILETIASKFQAHGMQLLGKTLLVWLDTGIQQTASGLVLPPDAQEIRQTGTIVAIGPDIDSSELSPSMRVLVDRTKGRMLGIYKNSPVNVYEYEDIFATIEY